MVHSDDGSGRGVLALLMEARLAGSRRLMDRVIDIFEDVRPVVPAPSFDRAAAAIRAMRLLEEVTGQPASGADLAPRLERLATAHLLASTSLILLRTSIEPLPLPGAAANCVVAVVRELLHVVDAAAEPAEGVEASLEVGRCGDLVKVVVRTSPDARAVLPATGVQALARLSRLADACGGAMRRRHDGSRMSACVVLDVRSCG